jgi:DNA-directed RNA polymerase subunit alpha
MDYAITLPSKPRIVSEEENMGIYEIDGLHPGYGYTLGNSLRRVILSSLPGAAITSVKIDGVSHEFSTLNGVKEDVVSIILNLKKVRLESMGEGPQTVTLSAKGVAKVTAGDITVPSQVRVLSPSEHIAELTDKNAKLTIEMTVEKGLGYVPKESLRKEKVDIGVIALDAIFTPIRRVNYEVENMRVGDRTDFNRLRIVIETDGTIAPRRALEQSIEIMIHQLKAVIGFREEEQAAVEPEREEKRAAAGSGPDADVLKTRIEDLEGLSTRTVNSLTNAGVRTIGGLARKSEGDVLEFEGMGEKGLSEIKRALANFGITLKS